MNLIINGEKQDVAHGQTVRELVKSMGLGGAAVAVELNREVVPRKEHETTVLNEGDVVEVVSLVGGG